MRVLRYKITLDKIGFGFYATASMRSPMSPDMLKGNAILFQEAERGD